MYLYMYVYRETYKLSLEERGVRVCVCVCGFDWFLEGLVLGSPRRMGGVIIINHSNTQTAESSSVLFILFRFVCC